MVLHTVHQTDRHVPGGPERMLTLILTRTIERMRGSNVNRVEKRLLEYGLDVLKQRLRIKREQG